MADIIVIAILETLAVVSLFLRTQQIILFLLFHISAIIYFALRKKIKNRQLIIYCLLIPYSAILFLIKNKKTQNFETIENIDSKKLFLLENIKPIKRTFGESTIHSLINNQNAPSEIRLRAFIILTELITPSTVTLLKNGLSDPNDEIRLLCYSVLNSIEKRIQNEIHNIKTSSMDINNKNKKLAKLNWELIYLNLVDKEFKNLILKEIYNCLENIKLTNDTELLKFRAKIYLYEKQYDKAYEIYKNFPNDEDVVPFLLEIFYYKKEYSKIKEYVKKYPYIKYYDKFYDIYRFWND